ncbi:hypothetical protein IW262DRAFT_1236305, partial [Armillaria fumosa]
ASISQTTRFAPFELNNRYLPSMLKEYTPASLAPPGIKKFTKQALANLAEVHDVIIVSHVFQMHYANKCQSSDPPIIKGDLVFLSTKN